MEGKWLGFYALSKLLNLFLDLASTKGASQGGAAGGAGPRLWPGRHYQGGAAPGDGGCWRQAELHPRLTNSSGSGRAKWGCGWYWATPARE